MIALMFGILILVFAAITNIFHQKELKAVRERYSGAITDLVDEKMELREQYHTIEVSIEDEIAALEEAIAAFEANKDPDSMFPAMESSISEANAKANVRMLIRLYEKLFPEAYNDWIRRSD